MKIHSSSLLWFLATVVSGPAVAQAQAQVTRNYVDIVLHDVTCQQSDQTVDIDLLRERIIISAGLAFDRDTLKALEAQKLGTLAASRTSGPLVAMLGRVTSLMDTTTPISLGDEPRFKLRRTEASAALTPREAAIAFVNGDTDGVVISCLRSSTPAAPIPVAPLQKSVLIVADSKADLIKVPRDRAFATVGFEDDRITGNTNFNVSIALARQPMRLTNVNPTTQISWTPFVQYNRRTAPAGRDQVNDLTLGSSFIVRNPLRVGGAIGFASLAYQTDDQTSAQVWVGDALVDFPRVGFCTRRDVIGWDMRCNISFVMDYANVNDPGDSRRLAILDRYLRVGSNLSLVAEQRFPIGLVSLNIGYSGRYDTLSGEATGELFAIGAGFRPSPSSNFSLETRYTVGTTLNTLVGVDKVSLRLGYRM